jgi:hypothetical protein
MLGVGTTTAGRVRDLGSISSLGISDQLSIVGKALSSAVAGGSFVMQVYGPGFYGQQPAAVIWSNLAGAATNLTLFNDDFFTTFNQDGPVPWTWANTASALASAPALIASGLARVHGTNPITLATTGSTLLVAVLGGFSAAATISDSQSNSWNYLTTYFNADSSYTRIAYAYSITTNAAHTFTVAGGGGFAFAVVYAFSNTLTTAAVYDSSSGANGPLNSPFQTGSITPTSGDLVVTGFSNDTSANTASIDSSFNTPIVQSSAADENGAGSYLLGASGSALNPTWTTTANGNSAAIACFKPASGGGNPQSSPIITLSGTYYTGSLSATDSWTIQDVLTGSSANGPSVLTFGHTGTTGQISISIPSASVLQWGTDTGISRLAADSFAFGNGTASDTTGNLSLNRVNKAGADFAGQVTVTAGNTTKAIAFANNYTGTGQPVIVLTPTSDPLALGVPVGFWVTYAGSAGAWSGFSVNVQTALAGNITFGYIVIGQP